MHVVVPVLAQGQSVVVGLIVGGGIVGVGALTPIMAKIKYIYTLVTVTHRAQVNRYSGPPFNNNHL